MTMAKRRFNREQIKDACNRLDGIGLSGKKREEIFRLLIKNLTFRERK